MTPTKIQLHRRSRTLEIHFDDQRFELSAEYLRVHSPSAEVRGHGPGQEQLVLNKSSVGLVGVEAQGNYAIKLIFDDGHDSGLYTWAFLYELGRQQDMYWKTYQDKVAQHQKDQQEGESQPINWVEPK